ncbi:kinase-like domain-containing protein [Lophiotrema nucula]|uniref:Kinase-like domain-containing protein n=1 Tax=Lophiotrema nucula TaxID=690887 RepID=A0A6A5YXX1_9PLEO|nr:kinase-like domain-containing protein [Lophiotrema nucula]
MAGELVAFFEVRNTGEDPSGESDCSYLIRTAPQVLLETFNTIDIYGNEEFYLGRNHALCRHHWSDPVISNKHLRVHCILYEQDIVAAISPFVYATDVSTNGTYLKKHSRNCTSSQGTGIRMGRNNGAFLLDDGDELRLSNSVTLVFHAMEEGGLARLSPTQEREKSLFSERYLVTGRTLGVGGYGRVTVGIEQKTQRQLACKVVDLRHLYSMEPQTDLHATTAQTPGSIQIRRRWPTKVAKCFREFDILKDLSHPNIIQLEKVFWSNNTIFIFQELVTGGDLFSFLEYKGGKLCDVEAAVIIRQILKGVQYLHNQGIVHRDLKPDNVLMTSLDDGARVVITDFGGARFLPKEDATEHVKTERAIAAKRQRMFSLVGTLEYTAPEIHKMNKTIPKDNGYSMSVDMWSIGSITVALLSGDVLFNDRQHSKAGEDPISVIMSLASRCDLSPLDDETHPAWSKVGSRPKDFIRKLLKLEEEERMTVAQALAHPWFSNKHHAAEFEALYERAIRDWRPRRKVFRLVESISKIPINLNKTSLPEELLSQETVSRFFAPPTLKSPVIDIQGSLKAGAYHRTNTPLPSIIEEVEHRSPEEISQFAQEFDDYVYDSLKEYANQSQRRSFDNSMNELPIDTGILSAHFQEEAGQYDEYGEHIIVPNTPIHTSNRRSLGAPPGARGTGIHACDYASPQVPDSYEEPSSADSMSSTQGLFKRRKLSN